MLQYMSCVLALAAAYHCCLTPPLLHYASAVLAGTQCEYSQHVGGAEGCHV